jgi:hypothetical protein
VRFTCVITNRAGAKENDLLVNINSATLPMPTLAGHEDMQALIGLLSA